MLAGDYPCQAYLGIDMGQDQACPLCKYFYPERIPPRETMVHLLSRCRATSETRAQYMPLVLNIISSDFPTNQILTEPNHTLLTQLILDPTSLNLPLSIRISPNHPALTQILVACRTYCFAIHKDRTRQLKNIK